MVFNVLLPLAFQSRFVRWEVADYGGLQPYSFYGWESREVTAVQSYFVKYIFQAQTTQLFFSDLKKNLFHAIHFLTCVFPVTDMLFMN